jgi:RNA-binding protein YhbY
MQQYRIAFIEKSTEKEETLTMCADGIEDALQQLKTAVDYTEIIKIEITG